MPTQNLTGTPLVKVEKGFPGLGVRVIQSYRAGNDTWRGKVMLSIAGEDFIELEGSVKDGRNGPWFAPASRSYEDQQGNTKYLNTYWFESAALGAAALQAVQSFLNNDAPVDDDDIPL
jgi:hypothetical protein